MSTTSNIASTGAPSAALLANVNPAAAAASTDDVAATQNNFLKLLVTQLQNQDPLNPEDNSQITSQLAQLSTVTGVNQLNTTLTALQSSYQTSESLQATNLINHGVLAAGNTIALSSSAAIFGVNVGTAADNMSIAIQDSTGKTVHTINMTNVPAGVLPLTWDGKLDDGSTVAPDGKYTFSVTATAGSTALTDSTALAFGTVASVSTGSGGVKLNVPALGQLNLSDVQQVL